MIQISMSNSQRLAIVQLILDYEHKDPITEFTDASVWPAVTVELAELLMLFMTPGERYVRRRPSPGLQVKLYDILLRQLPSVEAAMTLSQTLEVPIQQLIDEARGPQELETHGKPADEAEAKGTPETPTPPETT